MKPGRARVWKAVLDTANNRVLRHVDTYHSILVRWCTNVLGVLHLTQHALVELEKMA